MLKNLDLQKPSERELIYFRLKCLEIAVQMIGSKPYNPQNTLDDYFNEYYDILNIIADRITLCVEPHTD